MSFINPTRYKNYNGSVTITTSSTTALWYPEIVNTGFDRIRYEYGGSLSYLDTKYLPNGPNADLSLNGGQGTITMSGTNNFDGLQKIDMTGFNGLTKLDNIVFNDVMNGLEVLDLGIGGGITATELTSLDSAFFPNILYVSIANLDAITTLDLSSATKMTTIVTTGADGIVTLDFSNTPLMSFANLLSMDSLTNIDSIIIDLNSHGTSNGTLNYSSIANPPTAASLTAYNALVSRGWTVTGNIPV